MKITNNYNLPEPLYRAISSVYPPRLDRISVSQLIQPPLIRSLTMKHWNDLEEDASDRLWALLGQGIHYVLQGFTKGEMLAEERLNATVYGLEIRGRADLYLKESVEDWKVVSVWSFGLGQKIEWERQLNVYAFLFRHAGFTVKKLRVHAILRDWMRSKIGSANYPPIPFHTQEVNVWTPEEATKYVQDRVRLFQVTPQFPCNDSDKWMREGKLAVHKGDNKKALRLWDTEEEVQRFIKEYTAANPKVKLRIERRPAQYIRCESFCPVRKFCPINPAQNNSQEEENDGSGAA